MGAELVRYDGGTPSFTVTVVDFAGAIEPLLGLSGLVAKVMASRVEASRIQAMSARDRQRHEREMAGMRQQATVADRHSRRMYQARRAEIAAGERAEVRRGQIELRRLEQGFDAALCAIRTEGETRRYEADRRFATEIHRIDGALRAEMARLAEDRRRDQQVFAQARQQLRLAEAARRDLGKAMAEATRMMRGRSRFAELAALTVPALSQAMAAVVTQQQDGTVAVLEALSGAPRQVEARGRSARQADGFGRAPRQVGGGGPGRR